MKKLIPLSLLILTVFAVPFVYAATSVDLSFTPMPKYNQVWAYETYLVNITINEFNLSAVDLTDYSGDAVEILITGMMEWKGSGGYDFGTATTGYNYNLDEQEIQVIMGIDDTITLFNVTLEKDAFDYGIKPYESVEITIKINAYIVMSDDSLGPKIASQSITYDLVDETKVDYLNGKYLNMQEEINPVLNAPGLEAFNRERFSGILEEMNTLLTKGNYVEALGVWEDYNEDDRLDLINRLVVVSANEYAELESLRGIESQLAEAEARIRLLEDEYEQLEKTYFALANTYSQVNKKLETVKGNLSTAITAVFLAAILFYFLGRRGAKKEAMKELA
jgi:hypothetical protein